jgi:hypothetical protein
LIDDTNGQLSFHLLLKFTQKIFMDQQHATSNELNFTALASIEWQEALKVLSTDMDLAESGII